MVIPLTPPPSSIILQAVAEFHGPSLRSLQFGYHAESSALFFHPLPDEAVAVLASCTGLEALNLQVGCGVAAGVCVPAPVSRMPLFRAPAVALRNQGPRPARHHQGAHEPNR